MAETENLAEIAGRDGVPGQGPHMTIYLCAHAGRITGARFETYGCPVAIACGTWVTNWAKGRTYQDVMALEPQDLITVVGGIPLGKEHCATLAVNALRDASRQIEQRAVDGH